MSLAEAMLDIASSLEQCSDEFASLGDPSALEAISARKAMKGYAQQIRLVVKAVGNQEKQSSSLDGMFFSPDAQHSHFIEKEREKLREGKRKAELTEKVLERSVVVEGGPDDGTYIVIPGDAPNGAKFPTLGGVCVLEGNRLVFSENETKKYAKQLKGIIPG